MVAAAQPIGNVEAGVELKAKAAGLRESKSQLYVKKRYQYDHQWNYQPEKLDWIVCTCVAPAALVWALAIFWALRWSEMCCHDRSFVSPTRLCSSKQYSMPFVCCSNSCDQRWSDSNSAIMQ